MIHRFKLPINHLAGEPVNRDVDPVALLAFNDETILEACGIWWIAAALGDYINQQISEVQTDARSESIDVRTETE